MGAVRSREDYVAAAAFALGERGPVRGGREIPLSKAAAALGTTRSKLYRWWDTSSDLTDAVNVHTATKRPGWRHALVEHVPRLGLRTAVDLAVAEHVDDPGAKVRAIVASWPIGSAARQEIAGWERRWFNELGDLLAGLAESDEPRPWTDFAIALTAHVEGTLLLSSQLGMTPPTTLGAVAERHLLQLVEMTSGACEPLDDLFSASSLPPEPAAELIARLDGLLAGEAGRAISQPSRLVDLELLARRLSVRPRRLYEVWPTAHDLNGDIAVHAVRTQRELTERLTLAAISAAGGHGHTHFRDLFVSVLDAIIQGASSSLASEFLACAFAIDDPAITERVVAEISRWLEAQKVGLLALLQVIGFHLRSEIDPDTYVLAAFGATYGAERIAALHPDLVSRTVVMQGEALPTLPAGVNALFRAMTEPCDHDPRPTDRRHSMAPALQI